MAANFELYKDKSGEFRWRLTHTNGQVIANSGRGYTTKENAMNGISSVIQTLMPVHESPRSLSSTVALGAFSL
jgi:uncharacterized protein YegP (UPF0339 family)